MIEKEEFYNWVFGNLMDNTVRAMVAEFLVHKAVNATTPYRVEWDAYDVETPSGTKIEVKASGYVQSWSQPGTLSTIGFNIAKKNPWIADENRYVGKNCRYANVWVFCTHEERDAAAANPLNTEQWSFLVTTSEWLDAAFGDQKTIRRTVLLENGLKPCRYGELAEAITASSRRE